jgi:hypothetical protein
MNLAHLFELSTAVDNVVRKLFAGLLHQRANELIGV